jgi:hypothetical protein
LAVVSDLDIVNPIMFDDPSLITRFDEKSLTAYIFLKVPIKENVPSCLLNNNGVFINLFEIVVNALI